MFQGDIHPLADDLQDRAPLGRIDTVNHPFAAVDVRWQTGSHFPQRVERQRLVRLVAPGAEGLRVVRMFVIAFG